MVIAITGANGFVGSALLRSLRAHYKTIAIVRSLPAEQFNDVEYRVCGDIGSLQEGENLLSGVDVVIHTAAQTNVLSKQSDLEREYSRTNIDGALNLAKQAAKLGIKRFVFLSSIKVNGEYSSAGKPFREEVHSPPTDLYGLSKYKAEQGLLKIAENSSMEVVIVRPPLVYGPSAKGNFAAILNLVKKGYFLPLASAENNKRSFIALENLASFILFSVDFKSTKQIANQVFLISDGEDVSTAELFQRVAKAYGKKSCLFPFPPTLLRLGAKVLGKQGVADRLLGSLQVDISKARNLLGWEPVITMEEQLRKMAVTDVGVRHHDEQ